MSVGQNFPGGEGPFALNGDDIYVTGETYPGIVLIGSEVLAGATDIREISGSTWIVSNAIFSRSGNYYVQYNPLYASSAFIIKQSGTFQFATAPAGAPTPIVWTFSTVFAQVVIGTLAFDTVGIGANNPLTAVAARYPLSETFTPLRISSIAQAVTAPTLFNIAYGEAAITTPTPANTIANLGNCVFSTTAPPNINTPGVVQTFYPANAGGIYPLSGELTLRVQTPAGGGVSGLKVTMYGGVT